MLIGGIALGLLLGLLLGGKLERLADIRLRYLPLLFVAVIVRFGTEIALGLGVGLVDLLRVPLLRPRLRAAAVHAVAQPPVPGPRARLRRHRQQRRS